MGALLVFCGFLGAGGGLALAPLCGRGPLVGLILLVFVLFAVFRGWWGASPSPPLWSWAPCGAEFVGFCSFWGLVGLILLGFARFGVLPLTAGLGPQIGTIPYGGGGPLPYAPGAYIQGVACKCAPTMV